MEDHPCIKIGYSEPIGERSREPRKVFHPSRERLGFFGTVILDSDDEVLGFFVLDSDWLPTRI